MITTGVRLRESVERLRWIANVIQIIIHSFLFYPPVILSA